MEKGKKPVIANRLSLDILSKQKLIFPLLIRYSFLLSEVNPAKRTCGKLIADNFTS